MQHRAAALLEFAWIATGWDRGPGHTLQALVAAACYLPLHVRHVWDATRGSRPAGSRVDAGRHGCRDSRCGAGDRDQLADGAALACGVRAHHPASTPSLAVVAVLLAAPWPLAAAFGDPPWGAYTISVVWQSAGLFVLVWLAGATRRLRNARLELAEQAITRERLRIDSF